VWAFAAIPAAPGTVLEGVLKTSGRVRDFAAARQAGALRCTAAPRRSGRCCGRPPARWAPVPPAETAFVMNVAPGEERSAARWTQPGHPLCAIPASARAKKSSSRWEPRALHV